MGGKREIFVHNCQTLNVDCCVVSHVPYVAEQPQIKERDKSQYKTVKICEKTFLYRSNVFLSNLLQIPTLLLKICL